MATTAIVPGDKIKPKTNAFTREDLMAACKKRYNGSICVDLMDEALRAATLKEAVDILVSDTIYHDGHDRNLILTQEELKARRIRMNIIGVLRAMISTLKKGKVSQKSIEFAITAQMAMRKLKCYNVDRKAQYFLNEFKRHGLIFSTTIDVKDLRGRKIDVELVWSFREGQEEKVTDDFLFHLVHESNREDFA